METWKVEMIPYESYDRRRDYGRMWFFLSASPDEDLQGIQVKVYDDDYDQLVLDERVGRELARPSGWRPVYHCLIDVDEFDHSQRRSSDFKFDLNLEIVVRYDKEPLAEEHWKLDPWKTLSCNLDHLLQSGDSSDFTFEVDGEEISAHRIILSSRSSYFRGLFNSGMREATMNRMAIEDIDATTFKAVLKFLYCGSVPDDVRSSAMKYIPVAEKYDIKDLKDAAQFALAESLTPANVIDALVMAEVYDCDILKYRASSLFVKLRKSFSEAELEPLEAHPKLILRCMQVLL